MTFNGEESKSGRNEGISRVLSNNTKWADAVGAFIIALPKDWIGMAETIRREWQEGGGDPPSHPNAWGGVIHGAVKRGILIKTGKRDHMMAIKAHSRTTDVYRRSGNDGVANVIPKTGNLHGKKVAA